MIRYHNHTYRLRIIFAAILLGVFMGGSVLAKSDSFRNVFGASQEENKPRKDHPSIGESVLEKKRAEPGKSINETVPKKNDEEPPEREKGARIGDAMLGRPALHFKNSRIIYDRVNHLAWRRCSAGQTPAYKNCRGQAKAMNYIEAQEYCQALKDEGKTWRLPALREIESLLDKTATNARINQRYFPDTPGDAYWSAERYRRSSYSVMVFDFSLGLTYTYDQDHRAYVRCVAATQNN